VHHYGGAILANAKFKQCSTVRKTEPLSVTDSMNYASVTIILQRTPWAKPRIMRSGLANVAPDRALGDGGVLRSVPARQAMQAI
jgi:hypothetical protein